MQPFPSASHWHARRRHSPFPLQTGEGHTSLSLRTRQGCASRDPLTTCGMANHIALHHLHNAAPCDGHVLRDRGLTFPPQQPLLPTVSCCMSDLLHPCAAPAAVALHRCSHHATYSPTITGPSNVQSARHRQQHFVAIISSIPVKVACAGYIPETARHRQP